MNKNKFCSVEKELPEEETAPVVAGVICTSPTLGDLLPDYIAELLADSIEEEVEEHLLDCLHCREKYQKVLSIGNTLRKEKALRNNKVVQGSADECGQGQATVLQMVKQRKARA